MILLAYILGAVAFSVFGAAIGMLITRATQEHRQAVASTRSHELYLLVYELVIRDRQGLPVFPDDDTKNRATALVAHHPKEITR